VSLIEPVLELALPPLLVELLVSVPPVSEVLLDPVPVPVALELVPLLDAVLLPALVLLPPEVVLPELVLLPPPPHADRAIDVNNQSTTVIFIPPPRDIPQCILDV
jgi:hypothetical protein